MEFLTTPSDPRLIPNSNALAAIKLEPPAPQGRAKSRRRRPSVNERERKISSCYLYTILRLALVNRRSRGRDSSIGESDRNSTVHGWLIGPSHGPAERHASICGDGVDVYVLSARDGDGLVIAGGFRSRDSERSTQFFISTVINSEVDRAIEPSAAAACRSARA